MILTLRLCYLFRDAERKERLVVEFWTMNGPVQTQLFYCCAVKMCLSKACWWNQTEGERYTVLLVIVAQNGEWPCLLFSGVTGVLRQLKCLFVSACKLQRWLPCFFQPPGADATRCFCFTYQTRPFYSWGFSCSSCSSPFFISYLYK